MTEQEIKIGALAKESLTTKAVKFITIAVIFYVIIFM